MSYLYLKSCESVTAITIIGLIRNGKARPNRGNVTYKVVVRLKTTL